MKKTILLAFLSISVLVSCGNDKNTQKQKNVTTTEAPIVLVEKDFDSKNSQAIGNEGKTYLYEEEMTIQAEKKSQVFSGKSYPVLELPEAVTVIPDPNLSAEDIGMDEKETNVKIVQLAGKTSYSKYKGCIKAKGYFYHAENDFHKTKVLFFSDSYEPCESK